MHTGEKCATFLAALSSRRARTGTRTPFVENRGTSSVLNPDDPAVVFPVTLPRREDVSPEHYERVFEQVLLCTVDELLFEMMKLALVLNRGNSADARELVNDLFVKLQAKTFDRPTKGLAWGTRVVQNAFRSRYRRTQTETRKLGHRIELTVEIAEAMADNRGLGDVAETAIENVFSTPLFKAASAIIEEFIAAHEPGDTARVLRSSLDVTTGAIRSRNEVGKLTGLHPSKVDRLRKPALERLRGELEHLYKELQAGDGDVASEFLTSSEGSDNHE